jgi:hypothetical protein
VRPAHTSEGLHEGLHLGAADGRMSRAGLHRTGRAQNSVSRQWGPGLTIRAGRPMIGGGTSALPHQVCNRRKHLVCRASLQASRVLPNLADL